MDASYRTAKGNRCVGINGARDLARLLADVVGIATNGMVKNKDFGSTSTNTLLEKEYIYNSDETHAFFNISWTSG